MIFSGLGNVCHLSFSLSHLSQGWDFNASPNCLLVFLSWKSTTCCQVSVYLPFSQEQLPVWLEEFSLLSIYTHLLFLPRQLARLQEPLPELLPARCPFACLVTNVPFILCSRTNVSLCLPAWHLSVCLSYDTLSFLRVRIGSYSCLYLYCFL